MAAATDRRRHAARRRCAPRGGVPGFALGADGLRPGRGRRRRTGGAAGPDRRALRRLHGPRPGPGHRRPRRRAHHVRDRRRQSPAGRDGGQPRRRAARGHLRRPARGTAGDRRQPDHRAAGPLRRARPLRRRRARRQRSAARRRNGPQRRHRRLRGHPARAGAAQPCLPRPAGPGRGRRAARRRADAASTGPPGTPWPWTFRPRRRPCRSGAPWCWPGTTPVRSPRPSPARTACRCWPSRPPTPASAPTRWGPTGCCWSTSARTRHSRSNAWSCSAGPRCPGR